MEWSPCTDEADHTIKQREKNMSQEIEISEAPSIFFDFSRRYYGGQWTKLYRISCGTMYVDDIEHVEKQIEKAREENDGEEQDWNETLSSSENEIRRLKSKYL